MKNATHTVNSMIEFARLAGVKSLDSRPANFHAQRLEGDRDCYLVQLTGRFFRVWDNGGEVGVEELNSGELARFFPMSWFEEKLSAGTLYLRFVAVLHDEEIAFEDRLDDLEVRAGELVAV